MRMKNIVIYCVVLVLCLSTSFVFAQTSPQSEVKKEQLKREDVVQQIIQLVVENSPVLQQQREVISQIEKMPQPGEGFIEPEKIKKVKTGATEKGPFLTLEQVEDIRDRMIDRIKVLGEERRTYEDLKKDLLSELMNKITRILTLKNKKQNLTELKSFLEERKASLEKQVKAGVEEPSALFDVKERIMSASLNVQNTAVELEMLKLEVAANFGGQKQKELLSLLDKI